MTRSRLITRFVSLIFGAGFLVFGVSMLVNFFRVTAVQDQTASWPQATGEVIVSRLSTHQRRRNRRSYSVDIQYRFETDGRMRQGQDWYYGSNRVASSQDGNRVLADFPVGKKVPVYYNPADPDVAVLVTGRAPSYEGIGLLLTMGVPIVFSVIGAGLTGATILRWHKRWGKEKAA